MGAELKLCMFTIKIPVNSKFSDQNHIFFNLTQILACNFEPAMLQFCQILSMLQSCRFPHQHQIPLWSTHSVGD